MSASNALQSPMVYSVKRATPDQAQSIYELKVQAFGKNYLLYTIYQAPQSVRYIEQLIAQYPLVTNESFFVVEDTTHVLGYFHAVSRSTEYFLNYIAVDKSLRRHGLGRMLLDTYESSGRAMGYSNLSLDVFESNTPVQNWYLAHGYRQVGTKFHVRVATAALDEPAPVLTCDPNAFQEALEQERTWGFSKIELTGRSESVTVGLIGYSTCKLLAHAGLSVESASSAICRHFRDSRSLLIVSGLSQIPSTWRLVSQEHALRLTKSV